MKKNIKVLLIILCSLLVTIILVLLGYWLYNRDGYDMVERHKTLQVIETDPGVNAFKCDMTKLWGSAVESEFLAEILFDYDHISSSIDNIQPSSVLALSVNNNSVKDVKRAIDIAQPRVLLLLSDEWEDKKEYEELFSKVPLVYRQYRYDSYNNPPNQRILPLGYHCWDQHARRPSMPKKYIWSFIGTAKGDREGDMKVLDEIKPNFHGKTKAEENPDILNSSIFMYCPIGNYNVECFRQYTASMCGAIPCLVCTQVQWDSTYPYFDIEPPWLHADSAEKIRDMMKLLLENPDELRRLQRAVSKWWVDMKKAVYENINDVVTDKNQKQPSSSITSLSPSPHETIRTVLVGSLNSGSALVRLAVRGNKLLKTSTLDLGENPSALLVTAQGLYATNEVPHGRLVRVHDGRSTAIGVGDRPTALASNAAFVACANYGGGSVSLVNANLEGAVHTLRTPGDAICRTKGPPYPDGKSHPHSVEFIGDILLVVDLGFDSLCVYRNTSLAPTCTRTPACWGPRATVSRGSDVYVMYENACAVQRYVLQGDDTLTAMEVVKLRPGGLKSAMTDGPLYGGALVLRDHSIFATVRSTVLPAADVQSGNAVARISIKADGELGDVEYAFCGGSYPRGLAIDGRRGFVCNQAPKLSHGGSIALIDLPCYGPMKVLDVLQVPFHPSTPAVE